jgi:signal transduction histidine kinase
MQPLIGLLPILIEKEKDPEKKDALVVMNKNVEYMRDLIFETLELAKLRHSNIKFDIENVNLRAEAQDAIDTQKILLKENKISVDNKIDESIMVQADKLRLSEVFKNLITNSVKYTPDTGGKIIIDATSDDKWVTVSVKDTGIGMTKDQLKRVFNEFYKADKATSDYYSTGLGLPITKRIVEKHGGKIWVESEGPGKGSAFYFTLKKKTKNN